MKSRPSQPCPAGLHHWRDCYGDWHCTECDPPASLALVREERLVGAKIESESDTGNWGMILAIDTPGQPVLFAPNTTQAERREAAETFAWWDRHDARKNRFEKISARNANETEL